MEGNKDPASAQSHPPLKRTASHLGDSDLQRCGKRIAPLLSPQPIRPGHLHSVVSSPLQFEQRSEHRIRGQGKKATIQDSVKRNLIPSPRINQWLENLPLSFEKDRSRSDSFLLRLDLNGSKPKGSSYQLLPSAAPSSCVEDTIPDEMADTDASDSSKGVKNPDYRLHVLKENGIYIDEFGGDMTEKIRNYVDNIIDKDRDSPQPTDSEAFEARKTANSIINQTKVAELRFCHIRSAVSQSKHDVVTPSNPAFDQVVAPKPDTAIGFDYSNFSQPQRAQLSKSPLKTYGRPMSGDMIFPYLIFEVKSEAHGGTLYVAVNQGAGSGTNIVKGVEKLLNITNDGKSVSEDGTATMAFVMAVIVARSSLYVHFCKDKEYYLSRVKDFSILSNDDIRSFRKTVVNILDWGKNTRYEAIVEALQILIDEAEAQTQARTKSEEKKAGSKASGRGRGGSGGSGSLGHKHTLSANNGADSKRGRN